MGPKTKKAGREDLKAEDVLQAVVFADSFMKPRFAPLTAEVPKVLAERPKLRSLVTSTSTGVEAGWVHVSLAVRSHSIGVARAGPSAAGECADD
jgi:hypothetical protein